MISTGGMTTGSLTVKRRLGAWAPDLADLAMTLLGGLCAMTTFGSSYGGSRYLLVGLFGLVIGGGVAFVGSRWHQSVPVVLGEVVVAYFVLGGALAVPSGTVAGILPGSSSLSALSTMAVRGWTDLLSTAPVVGDTDNLLVIPLLCGVVAGAATMLLARRLRASWPALLPPVSLLAIGILFGTAATPSRLVSGGALAAVLLAWSAFRVRAERVRGIGTASRRGPWRAVALLAVACLVGVAVAPSLPGASSRLRYVLRDHVALPFDIHNFPSPLAAYRHYVLPAGQGGLRTTPLFKVTGAPVGSLLRIATLDDYHGVVFTVAGGTPGSSASGSFTTVGDPVSPSPCTAKAPCRRATVTVTDLHYSNVWLPDVGTVREVAFRGPAQQAERDAFRYNVATNDALLTTGLQPGERYTLQVEVPTLPPAGSMTGTGAAPASLPALSNLPKGARLRAAALTAGASTDFGRAQQMSGRLASVGAYSDGTSTEAPSLPGEGEYRLEQFLSMPQPVGDAEQYASSMDLMARSLGLPARIVMGAKLSAGTSTVTGSEITAWVEVKFAGLGWYPFFPTPPTTATVRAVPPPPPPSSSNQAQYNAPAAPQAGSGSVNTNAITKGAPRKTTHSVLAGLFGTVLVIAGWTALVLAVLGGPLAAIAWLKARRRARRRSAGRASDRVAGGWQEVLDRARDMGRTLPATGTRREMAVVLGGSAAPVAHRADLATFGPTEPDDAEAEAFWALVDESLADMDGDFGIWTRLRVTLNPASLMTGQVASRIGGARATVIRFWGEVGRRIGRPGGLLAAARKAIRR